MFTPQMLLTERKRIAHARKASWDDVVIWRIAFISEISHTCFIWHSIPNAQQTAPPPAPPVVTVTRNTLNIKMRKCY